MEKSLLVYQDGTSTALDLQFLVHRVIVRSAKRRRIIKTYVHTLINIETIQGLKLYQAGRKIKLSFYFYDCTRFHIYVQFKSSKVQNYSRVKKLKRKNLGLFCELHANYGVVMKTTLILSKQSSFPGSTFYQMHSKKVIFYRFLLIFYLNRKKE